MIPSGLLDWLLEGDVAIQFQVRRDLCGEDRPDLQARIASEGWGAQFMAARHPAGHWGRGFYQPKWISTHYTLLDLKHLGIKPENALIRHSIQQILETNIAADGGVHPIGTIKVSDACINGMFLNYACYFGMPGAALESIVDFVIANQMPDGGFNCRLNRSGAVHSSMHTTISILEGLLEYEKGGYTYRLPDLLDIAQAAQEFLLQHQLFRSDHTGEIIDKRFLLLSFPSRWYFDILRALDYFRDSGTPYDVRMQAGLDVLQKKRRSDGTWPVQGRHAGQVHFEMERSGKPSRWNTLRALRVLRHNGLNE